MSLFNVTDKTQCKNCNREFADHNYVPDSIDKYECPVKQQNCGYGHFHGGDPRAFHPDYEACHAEEIESHIKACELWRLGEIEGETPTPENCPSGWNYNKEGGRMRHVLNSSYGIGMYTWEEETMFEARDIEDNNDEVFRITGI